MVNLTVFSTQAVNPKDLNDKISLLNDQFKYDDSFLQIEKIITHPKSTAYDLFNAYIQKSLTYKRLYNYPEVLHTLDLAEEYANEIKDEKLREDAIVRVLVEKMFVIFDTQKYDEVKLYLHNISKKNIASLSPETKAFYFNVLAVMSIREKDYVAAENTLNKGIDIIKLESPKHLPAVYAKKIGLYENTKDRVKAELAFKEGLYYAQKYKMMIYEKLLYYTMSHFYAEQKNFEDAYVFQSIGVELTTKYDANNYNGKLTLLDKDLLDKRKNIEIAYEKNIKYFLVILSFIFLALIIVLVLLYKANKQKNAFMKIENERMRSQLENLTKEINEAGESKIKIDDYNLTERQIEIINLVKKGITNKEIGTQLFISENTVKYHLKIIYNVLGIENRFELKS